MLWQIPSFQLSQAGLAPAPPQVNACEHQVPPRPEKYYPLTSVRKYRARSTVMANTVLLTPPSSSLTVTVTT